MKACNSNCKYFFVKIVFSFVVPFPKIAFRNFKYATFFYPKKEEIHETKPT